MCPIGLIVEYSRMKVPSLSRGCEIAQFFVRYMVEPVQQLPDVERKVGVLLVSHLARGREEARRARAVLDRRIYALDLHAAAHAGLLVRVVVLLVEDALACLTRSFLYSCSGTMLRL